jgi:glucose/arabinose dehydrogenase/PKD repeat protein
MASRAFLHHASAPGLLMAALAVLPAAASPDCTIPPEIGTLLAQADKLTYTWPAEPSATRYSVVRGEAGALPVGPGGADETCVPDLSVPALEDAEIPPPGTAFWYLARGEHACANGTFGIQSDGAPRVTTTCPLDESPPAVSVTSPAASSILSSIVDVTADASDDFGVAGVQFHVDGISVGLEDTEAPHAVSWDTRTVSNGPHTITARARDAAGNTTTSSGVAVDVANTDIFQNEILATGFDLPIKILFLPDDRMLVAELAGTIKVLPPPYTTPDPTPFLELDLDIPGYAGLQQGIMDVALDPDFLDNHYYYVFYTNDEPNTDRLSRFTAASALDGTIAGSELILYQDPQLADTEHHGGAVNFGNDGKIYFTTGEHFNAGNAQDLTNPRGKIHRIDPDGGVPTDNPFHDGAGPHWDSIWAYGLRNPFRAYYDAPTGRLYVADVGGNNYSTAYEEVDLGEAGKNYGWPNCEFGTCGNPGYSAALYAYPHLGRDASITGGFVYHGTQFPASYQGSYFFADYTQNWIRRLTFDAQGNVDGVFDFEPPDGSLDGPYGDIVCLAEGPDGALYYLDLGYSDVGGQFGIGKVRRIHSVSSNLPPTAIASADPTEGPVPLVVSFSSAGSADPENQPITYLWTFGDGQTSTAANPVHPYTSAGKFTARLTTFDGVNDVLSAPLTISAGTPPVGEILSPEDGSFFVAGDVISYGGDGTDDQGATLPASAFTWDIDFLHEGHVHPGVHEVGVKSGVFLVPTSGHDFSGDTRYRFTLTVTLPNGLTDVESVTVWPSKVNLTFDTLPAGLTIHLDGIAQPTPLVYDTLIDFQHDIEAPDQSTVTTIYTFDDWSDGGTQMHTITVPATDASYTASFTEEPNTTPFEIGETAVFEEFDCCNGNLLLVQDAALSQPGTLQSLSFYVTAAAGGLRLGIYDATGPGGGPGAKLAETNAFTPVVGWNTANVIPPVALAPGDYWLAYLPESNDLEFRANREIGQFLYYSYPFGPLPETFSTSLNGGVTRWSFYGTLTP